MNFLWKHYWVLVKTKSFGRGGGNRTPIDGFGDRSCTIQLHPYGYLDLAI
jgi:hypothetical protein